MNTPLVDSNYIIGLMDEGDSLHANAVRLQTELSRFDLIVPDVSLIEAVSVLARRFEEKGKSGQFPEILASLNSLFPPDELLWLSDDSATIPSMLGDDGHIQRKTKFQ